MIVGINSFFEHPAVAILRNGRVDFAAEDERFTGIKHGRKYNPHVPYLPVLSMYRGLVHLGATSADIEEVAYSYSGALHARSLSGCFTGKRFSSFSEEWSALQTLRKLRRSFREGHDIPQYMRSVLRPDDLARVKFTEWPHHDSHAASAYYCSGFDRALVLVSDGAGEAACTSVYLAEHKRLKRIAVMELPHSLGHFYTTVTQYLGFEPFSDEFKVMGLSGYGLPAYFEVFERLLQLLPEGRYRLNVDMLRVLDRHLPPRRRAGDEIAQHHRDIAKSAQVRLEQAIVHVALHHAQRAKAKNLCLAGGTFLNCIANGRLVELGIFDRVFAQPAASDAGTAIGAAALSARARGYDLEPCKSFALGTEYSDEVLGKALKDAGLDGAVLDDQAMIERLAHGLAQGKIYAIFRGRMEFGPRALGMRSLLASPCTLDMRERLNAIKGREGFRPVAPIVVRDAFGEYFDGHADPYMLFASRVRPESQARIPSATHVDGTARVQAIEATDDPFLHALLVRFGQVGGVPILINTSFNVRGKPIIESPTDALACYCTSRIDGLMFGSMLLEKSA